jgi:hypothetical protein
MGNGALPNGPRYRAHPRLYHFRPEERGKARPLCPCTSDINLFRYCERIVNFDTEIVDCAFDLRMTEQQLNRTEITGPAVDEGRLCAAERVRPEEVRIQANARNPTRDKASVLTCRQRPVVAHVAGEQELTRPFSSDTDVRVDSLPRLLGQLESNRSAGLLLANGRTIDHMSTRRNIFDLQTDEITAAQLAVDREVKHRQIARSASNL